MQDNQHIKPRISSYYAIASVSILMFAIAGLLLRILDWQAFAVIIGGIATFALGVQKQYLAEIKLFKKLFDEFNTKYDGMNNDLNQIHGQPSSLALTPEEKKKLYKYFNLCGEEWLFAKKGFICEEVWMDWKTGMEYFRGNDRIKHFWDEELKKNGSYYGLSF